MQAITNQKLDNWFTYHAPNAEQQEKLVVIRTAAREFAQVLVDNTIPSADQSAAIRLLREAVMTANASIVLNGE